MNDGNKPYDYTSAGLDGFLSRSIDNLVQETLDSPGPVSNSMAYDRNQVTGPLGDTLQIGNIRLENTRIVVSDGSNDFVLIGDDSA